MNTEEIVKAYEDDLLKKVKLNINGFGSNIADPDVISIYVNYPEDEDERIRFYTVAATLSNQYFDKYKVMITPVAGEPSPAQNL